MPTPSPPSTGGSTRRRARQARTRESWSGHAISYPGVTRPSTGEVKIGFYQKGVRLRFERGRLTGVEDWPQTSAEVSDARFPDLTFLQLLFGFRSLEELEYAFPDCQAPNNQARVILRAIFPKQPSYVWPVA
jgi:hypothetical protein